MDARRRHLRDKHRDQNLTALRALAWLATSHRLRAAPVRVDRGMVTLTYHVDHADYGEALGAVREIVERRQAG